MNAKLTLALLFGTLLIFTSSARATTIRPGSEYGQNPVLEDSVAGVGDDYFVCDVNSGPAPSDCGSNPVELLLQLTSSINGLLEVTVPDLAPSAAAYQAGSSPFGLITCSDFSSTSPTVVTIDSQLGSVCTPTPAPGSSDPFPSNLSPAEMTCAADLGTALTSVTGPDTTITLSASCAGLANATFYFDEVPPSGSGYSTASLTLVPIGTPEPSSLGLLGIGLAPLALLAWRRLQA